MGHVLAYYTLEITGYTMISPLPSKVVKKSLQKFPFKKWIYKISWFTLKLTVDKQNRRKNKVCVARLRILAIALTIGFFSLELHAAIHRPQDFLNAVAGKVDEGEKIVGHFCAVCHALKPQIPMGAPRQGIASDWNGRVKEGLEILLKNTEAGLNGMPARGGCFECSDEQLVKAIVALVPNKNKKALWLEYKKSNIEKMP